MSEEDEASSEEPKVDYDGAWKEVLEHYLRPFLELCFPHVAREVDWSRELVSCETELQELMPDSDSGRKHVDKLIKVWLEDGSERRVYIHIEVQSDRDSKLPRRLYQYHYRLVDRYKVPIATVVVLSDDDPSWRPGPYLEEFLNCRVCFEYPVCKLLDLEEREDRPLETDNPVAILIAAHLATKRTGKDMDQRMAMKWELLRRVPEHGYDEEMVGDLLRMIDWFMKLPKNKNLELKRRILEDKDEKMIPYITSFQRMGREEGLEEGLEKGLEEGLEKGRTAFCEAIIETLEIRFGMVPTELREQLTAITDLQQLKKLHRQAVTCQRLEDFEIFL